MTQEKIVTELGLRTMLEQLYAWMPFIKRNKDVHFGEGDLPDELTSFSIGVGDGKVAFEVRKDGKIFIVDVDGTKINLQDALRDSGHTIDLKMTGYNNIIIDHEGVDMRAYDIKETDDFKTAIKKLDNRSETGVIKKSTYLSFPVIGKMGIIYVDLSDGVEYVWNSKKYAYEPITPNQINGGNAFDFK